MKTGTCSCHGSEVVDVCKGGLERPRYFPRQLLTPADLTLEQHYVRDKLRRHNRLVHGWGVVCGAVVCRVAAPPAPGAPPAPPKFQPWKVRISPGYILGPYGDEILIEQERVVDLRTAGSSGGHGDDAADPWCAQVFVERQPGKLYVAVRYQEILAKPVRVEPVGCDCDETRCELSRVRDGYEIGILNDCPDSHENPPEITDPFKGPIPECPECPTDPWVVLAEVEVDPDGAIKLIDNCKCRRLVLATGHLWWRCEDPLPNIEVTLDPPAPPNPKPGDEIKVILKAEGIPLALTVDLGQGITIKKVTVLDDNKTAVVEVKVELNAVPGPRRLTLWDANGCFLGRKDDALTIDAPQPSPVAPSPAREAKPRSRAVGR